MNEQQNELNSNAEINDLETNCADEVKGGMLKRIRIGGMSVAEQSTALPDLEPKGEVKGGPGGWGTSGVLLNHNETTEEDEQAEAETEALDDLAVDEQETEVRGGGGITKLGSRLLNLEGFKPGKEL